MRPALALKAANETTGSVTGGFHPAGTRFDDVFLENWRALSELSADPNVFFEPWMMGPALDELAPRTGSVGLFRAEDRHGRLTGLLPLARGGLARLWSVWSHTHCFDNTPLIRDGECQSFLEALFGWLDRQGASVVVWPTLARDTAFSDHLFRFLEISGRARLELRHSARPLLQADQLTVPAYLGASLSRSRRRGIERRQRRLSQAGRLLWRQIKPGENVDDWCRRFLELEASGWKGRIGTAMQSRPAERAFFEAIATFGAQLDRVMVNSLELDGCPIAMTVNFRKGNRIWAFKTAYDEAMSAFGPGVLAEIEDARRAIDDPMISWVDSCSHAENRLMNELWPHRRPLVDLMVAVRPGARRDLLAFGASHFSLRALCAAGRRLSASAEWLGRRYTLLAVGAPRRRDKK